MMEISDKEFEQLTQYIKKNYGIHLKQEKRSLVTGRLTNLLINEGFSSFTEFYEHLVNDQTGKSATDLINRITTNHTYFMREKEHFSFFEKVVMPYLVETVKNRDLRIWSAGCSSGQEAYTLTMLMKEYFNGKDEGWDTTILATDISMKALDAAKKGVYPLEALEPLPPTWRTKYFMKNLPEAGKVTIKEEIKKQVVFGKFNLLEDRNRFKKPFDVIFCRNVMIYFDEKTKAALIERFYKMLKPGGYLFIGHSETVDRRYSKFAYVKPATYRKREGS